MLAGVIADVVGLSHGPMRTHSSELRAEAKVALDYFFEVGIFQQSTDYMPGSCLGLVRMSRCLPSLA